VASSLPRSKWFWIFLKTSSNRLALALVEPLGVEDHTRPTTASPSTVP
jgi:hypothetical protein